ncbi:MAG: tetratricopeptide repeat protein [Flavobacteriales bacterium]|nr:tetratricopeptide repeat protein [Flavobacteriales bacterium]
MDHENTFTRARIGYSCICNGPGSAQQELADISTVRSQERPEAETASANIDVPLDRGAAYTRALSRITMGDAEGALPDLDRILELDPSNSRGLLSRAKAYAMLGESDAAKADLEIIRMLNTVGPEAQSALHQLGELAIQEGDMYEAERNYERLVQIAPKDALAFCNLGIKASHTNGYDALADLDTSIADPTIAKAHLHRAILLLRHGRRDEACAAVMLQAREMGDPTVGQLLFLNCQ